MLNYEKRWGLDANRAPAKLSKRIRVHWHRRLKMIQYAPRKSVHVYGSYAFDDASRVMVVAPYLLWKVLFRRIDWIFAGHVTSQQERTTARGI